MTQQELEEKLRALGLDPQNPTWVQSGGVDLGKLPVLAKQRELLIAIKDLLKKQLHTDLVKLDEANEALSRLTHGGGT